jgi:hypothetical protein
MLVFLTINNRECEERTEEKEREKGKKKKTPTPYVKLTLHTPTVGKKK